MITECPYCDSKVDCEEKGHIEADLEDTGGTPTKLVLLECKVCKNALLGASEVVQVTQDKWEWDTASRLWPAPDTEVDWEIPEIARNSLVEAKVCFKAKA